MGPITGGTPNESPQTGACGKVAYSRALLATRLCRSRDSRQRAPPGFFEAVRIDTQPGAKMLALTEAVRFKVNDLEPSPIEPSWIIEGNPEARSRLLSTSTCKTAW